MIVITGAAEFIGSNVVAALNDHGRMDIAICDRLGTTQRWFNLRKRAFRDFLLPEELIGFLGNRTDIEAIVHLGANSSTQATDGDAILRSNFKFSLSLLDWCAEHQTPLIYASSAATYGDGTRGFRDGTSLSELRKLCPLNLYGWSKHIFDLVVAERLEQHLPLPPKCIGLKFFNVFGQNEYHKGEMMSVVARNFEVARQGDTVKLFKSYRNDFVDGGQKRDFIYVDDVVDVVLWCLDKGPRAGLFNVGTGNATTFQDLVEALFTAIGRQPSITYVPMPEALRDKYQYFTEAPLQRLRAAGYERPFTSIDKAVGQYVSYLLNQDRYR